MADLMDWRGLYNPNLSLEFAWTLFQHRRRRHYNKGKKQNSAKTIRNVKTYWQFPKSILLPKQKYQKSIAIWYQQSSIGIPTV